MKDFSSKCDQIRRKLRIWSHLLEKSLMENFIFCALLIDGLLEKFSQTLSICIIRNKEASFLHHIFRYLKELWN